MNSLQFVRMNIVSPKRSSDTSRAPWTQLEHLSSISFEKNGNSRGHEAKFTTYISWSVCWKNENLSFRPYNFVPLGHQGNSFVTSKVADPFQNLPTASNLGKSSDTCQTGRLRMLSSYFWLHSAPTWKTQRQVWRGWTVYHQNQWVLVLVRFRVPACSILSQVLSSAHSEDPPGQMWINRRRLEFEAPWSPGIGNDNHLA